MEEDVLVADGSARPAANSGAGAIRRLAFGRWCSQPEDSPLRTVTSRVGRSVGSRRSAPHGDRMSSRVRGCRRTAAGSPCLCWGGIAVRTVWASTSGDLARNALTPLTRTNEWGPMWSADGSHVLFMAGGRDWTRPRRRVLHRSNVCTRDLPYPHTITRDGATLLFQKPSPDAGSNIWMMSLGADRTRRVRC